MTVTRSNLVKLALLRAVACLFIAGALSWVATNSHAALNATSGSLMPSPSWSRSIEHCSASMRSLWGFQRHIGIADFEPSRGQPQLDRPKLTPEDIEKLNLSGQLEKVWAEI